jgi:GT2 family glycosyltransferase
MIKEEPSVLAVIPTWNSGDELRQCLKSMLNLHYRNIRLIIADNDSADNTPMVINDFRKEFQKKSISFEYVQLNKNYGYTGAVDRVLKENYRGEDYILNIDSDIEIQDGEILHQMISILQDHPKVGIIGPRMKIPSLGKDIVAAYWIKTLGTAIEKEALNPTEADMVNGGFLLIRSELYERLENLMSEILFYGWTELDLSERARRLGYKTYFYPHATVQHKLMTMLSRSERQIYYDLRNLLLVNWKYGSTFSRFMNFIVLFLPRIVYWVVFRTQFNLPIVLRAVKDFLILRKRYINEGSIQRK